MENCALHLLRGTITDVGTATSDISHEQLYRIEDVKTLL